MAMVYISIKIMPASPETDMSGIEETIKAIVSKDGSKLHTTKIVPIAFGLNALEIIFMRDESRGDTEPMEKEFSQIEGVESVEVTDVRRAFG